MAIAGHGTLGPWTPKVTRIINMWTQPCDVNPVIWVLGYFAASPVIAFTILAPDCLDIASERLRQGHKKRRKSVLRLADFADPINVPGKGLQHVAFALHQATQRIGWYFTIIDATLEWVIHGTSLAYQWSGCQDPNAPRAHLSMQNSAWSLPWVSNFMINTWHVDSAVNISAGPGGIAAGKDFSIGVGFTLTQVKDQFPGLRDADYTARLVDLGTGTKGPWISPNDYQGNSRSTSWFTPIAGALGNSHLYRVEINKSVGVLYGSGTMTAGGDNFTGVFKSGCG